LADTPILISAAVAEEVSGIIRTLRFAQTHIAGRRQIVTGRLNDKTVSVLVTGPGQVNTAQALTAAIECVRPSLIIQTGCGGAYRESGLVVGDIAVAVEEIDAHLGIENPDSGIAHDDLPFSVARSDTLEIKNRYPICPERVDAALAVLKPMMAPAGVHCMKGAFLTVSTLTATDQRAADLYRIYKACMENMEGAAAAHVAVHYGVPLVEVRSVSNRVGKRDLHRWNLPLAFERIATVIPAIVQHDETGRLIETLD